MWSPPASVGMLILFTLPTVVSAQDPARTETDCSQFDLVRYSQARRDYLAKVQVVTVNTAFPPQDVLAGLEAERSPHATSALYISRPDTTKPGPWQTHVYVTGNKARPLSLEVVVKDHHSYDVRTRWINEKLLWLVVWWGRIASTELILNVETATFEYAEDADYGILILPCSERRGISE